LHLNVDNIRVIESESAEWISTTQVQEQQWLAETVGRLHKLLSLFLQEVPGIIYSSGSVYILSWWCGLVMPFAILQCWQWHYIFGLMSAVYVCSFVLRPFSGPILLPLISHEQLEQSQWNLQGIFTNHQNWQLHMQNYFGTFYLANSNHTFSTLE